MCHVRGTKSQTKLSAFPFLNQCHSCHFNGQPPGRLTVLLYISSVWLGQKNRFAYNATGRVDDAEVGEGVREEPALLQVQFALAQFQ